MKKSLLSLIGASLLLSGCNNNPQNSDDLTRRIEREIRKNDSWVVSEIESDYTNALQDAPVTLRRPTEEKLDKSKELGFLPTDGSFSLATNVLTLPFKEENSSDVLDAVDHELWHALYDSEGDKGIIHREGYIGPNKEEIESFCKRKIAGKEFDGLKNRLLASAEIESMKGLDRAEDNYTKEFTKALEEWSSANKILAESKLLSLEEREILINNSHDLRNNIESFRNSLNSLSAEVQNYSSELESKAKSGASPLEQLLSQKELKMKMHNLLRQSEPIIEKCYEFRSSVENADITAKRRDYEQQIVSLESQKAQATNDEIKSEIEETISTYKGLREMSDLLEKQRSSFVGSSLRLLNLNKELESTITQDNMKKINQILGDPDEVMARVVDSLYSLHYSQVEQNKFPLNNEDLDFLRRFSYNGEPLFKKGIEKYALGLKMISQGVPADKVKHDLEYATSYKHDSHKYSWPESKFTIKGNIPYSK